MERIDVRLLDPIGRIKALAKSGEACGYGCKAGLGLRYVNIHHFQP